MSSTEDHLAASAIGASERREPFALPDFSRSMQRVALVFFLSLAFSVFYFRFGPYVAFNQAGYLDPWIYTGYFTNFKYMVHQYGATYYLCRLPWILPGVLVYKILPPLAAALALKAGLAAISVTALYFTIEPRYGWGAALLSSVALIINPYFIAAISWQYPDGPAIMYGFLALMWLLHPRVSPWTSAICGGMFLALCGYTNLAALPVLIAICIIPLWRYRNSFRQIVRQALGIFIGGCIATLVFSIPGKLILNMYLFFWPQIGQILYTRSHPNYLANMWGTGNAWIPSAFRLAPVLMMLILGAICWFRKRRDTEYSAVYLFFLISCLLFAIFEFGLHNTGLRVSYQSSYIVVPTMALVGFLIGECLNLGARNPIAKADRVIYPAIAIVGLIVPSTFVTLKQQFTGSDIWYTTLGVTIVAALLLILPAGKLAGTLLTCLLFMGVFLGPALDGSLGYIWSPNRATFDSIVQLGAFVDSHTPYSRHLKFWYDPHEHGSTPGSDLTGYYDSTYSLYLWGYDDLTKQLPVWTLDDLHYRFDTPTTLVHLTTDRGKMNERTRLLASRGILVGNERGTTYNSVYGPIDVVLQDVLDTSHLH